MRETRVWKALREGCEALDCLCEKWESPNRRGPPDAIITPPGIPVEFVETKRPKKEGGKVRAHQARDHERRRKRGHRVTVTYTVEEVKAYLADLARRIREEAGGVTLH